MSKGATYSCGSNSFGVLGQATLEQADKRKKERQGCVRPVPMPRLKKDVIGIATGVSHALAWTKTGALYSWGKLQYGCLGFKLSAFDDYIVETPTYI